MLERKAVEITTIIGIVTYQSILDDKLRLKLDRVTNPEHILHVVRH